LQNFKRKKEPHHVRKDPIAALLLDKYMGKDGTMSQEQIKAFVKDYRAKRISPKKEAMWQRGASNAACHYLGCAKTFAQIGRAFAEAILEMEAREKNRPGHANWYQMVFRQEHVVEVNRVNPQRSERNHGEPTCDARNLS